MTKDEVERWKKIARTVFEVVDPKNTESLAVVALIEASVKAGACGACADMTCPNCAKLSAAISDVRTNAAAYGEFKTWVFAKLAEECPEARAKIEAEMARAMRSRV